MVINSVYMLISIKTLIFSIYVTIKEYSFYSILARNVVLELNCGGVSK